MATITDTIIDIVTCQEVRPDKRTCGGVRIASQSPQTYKLFTLGDVLGPKLAERHRRAPPTLTSVVRDAVPQVISRHIVAAILERTQPGDLVLVIEMNARRWIHAVITSEKAIKRAVLKAGYELPAKCLVCMIDPEAAAA